MMVVETPQQLLDVEGSDAVLTWRFHQLRLAGYDEAAAGELAARADVDLHVALDLLGRGCPQALALEILR